MAASGSRLVLAARDGRALELVADRCLRLGAQQAIATAVDLADAGSVVALGSFAAGRLREIDVWVNVAAVLDAGDLTATPTGELERVVSVNVTGTMLAAREALQIFDRQGRGTLINVASVLALMPNPLTPAYTASKYAIRGLTQALQQRATRREIDVCLVLPGPVDTPLWRRAANHTGRRLRPIPPAMSPWRVARSIERCARRPRAVVTTGWTARSLVAAHRLAPATAAWAVARSSRLMLGAERSSHSAGAIVSPEGSGAVDGGFRRGRIRRRAGDRLGRGLLRRAWP
jgi:short-subunit dehydrogenase